MRCPTLTATIAYFVQPIVAVSPQPVGAPNAGTPADTTAAAASANKKRFTTQYPPRQTPPKKGRSSPAADFPRLPALRALARSPGPARTAKRGCKMKDLGRPGPGE